MSLTEEQQERIRANRERALELRQRKKIDAAGIDSVVTIKNLKNKYDSFSSNDNSVTADKSSSFKRHKAMSSAPSPIEFCNSAEGQHDGIMSQIDITNDRGVILEDFEITAPTTVTKKEAMKMYCLPEGTLQVCSFVEKTNPHRRGFSSMKLFDRSEIRRRARDRFGGLDGLIAERKKREMKRFERTLEQTKNAFKSTKKLSRGLPRRKGA